MPHREGAAPASTGEFLAGFDHDVVSFDAAAPDERPPVRIFIGTEDGQWRAERVLLWSIEQVRDPSRNYEIHLMRNLPGFQDGRWLTGFTNYRFLIPHLTGGVGRAIYNDVDQIYLRDPALLFDLDLGDHGYVSINERDTSVMMMDTARMLPIWPLERIQRGRRKSIERLASSTPGLWGRLDGGWNARDTEYEPGRSNLVHFTTIHTQPWMPFPKLFTYQHNPVGELWFDLERSAEAAGFHVYSEARPSLRYRQLLSRLSGSPQSDAAHAAPSAEEQADCDRMLDAVSASSVLQYGIAYAVADGASDWTAAQESTDRSVTAYDPASRPLDKKPAEKFDAVVFQRGLEQVPDTDLPWLIESLFQLARQALHVSIDDDAPNPNGNREGWGRDRFFWSELFAAAGGRHPEVDWRLVGHHVASGHRQVSWVRGRGWAAGSTPRVWVVVDDKVGHTNQSVGLAEALGWKYELRRISPSFFDRVSNRLLGSTLLGIDMAESDPLEPPWPDVVISTGRRGAPVCRWIATQSRGHTRVVQIGRKGADIVDALDLAVTCSHFQLLPHPRRLETTTPINGVTDETLAEARVRWRHLVANPDEPPVVLLVGGASPHHYFDAEAARRLGKEAVAFAAGREVLAITSPRTGESATAGLAEGLGTGGRLHRFGQGGEMNPYVGHLAWAAAIVVSGESESMLGEALATGAPTYIYPIESKPPRLGRRFSQWVRARAYARPVKRGKGSVRPQAGSERFWSRVLALGLVRLNRDLAGLHAGLVRRGIAQMFGAPLQTLRRTPLREVEEVAGRVALMMSLSERPPGEALPELQAPASRAGDFADGRDSALSSGAKPAPDAETGCEIA